VERRVEESVYGIRSEGRSIFSAGVVPPEITLTEYESKQCAENVEDGEALLFVFAESRQSFSQGDGFTKSLKFGYVLDMIVFMV